MVTLEAAMLTSFGEEVQALFNRIMTGATGSVVTTTVLEIAIYMIMNSTKQIKNFNLQAKEVRA